MSAKKSNAQGGVAVTASLRFMNLLREQSRGSNNHFQKAQLQIIKSLRIPPPKLIDTSKKGESADLDDQMSRKSKAEATVADKVPSFYHDDM